MQKQKRRRFAAVLAVLLLLIGCGKREAAPEVSSVPGVSADSARTEVLTGVYRGTELVLPEGYNTLSASRLAQVVPGIDRETGTVSVYTQDAYGRGIALTLSLNAGVVREVEVPIPDGQRLSCGVFDGDDFFYITAEEVGENGVQDAVVMNLHRLDCSTGEVVSSGNLRGLFSTADEQEYGLSASSLAVDADGDYWIGTGDEILVLSPEFQWKAAFTGRFNLPMRLTAAPDGSVWHPNSETVRIYDKNKPDAVETLLLPERPTRIVFCEGFDFCYSSGSGVYGAMLDGKTVTAACLMSFGNSSVDAQSSSFLGAFDTEDFLFVEGSPARFSVYQSSEDVNLSTLRVIEVASAFDLEHLGSGFTTRIVEFNKSHPDCRAVVKDYSQYSTAENPDGGTNRLMMDILTGIYRPDIVIGKTRGGWNSKQDAAVIETLVRQGLYTDLSPFLDADDTVNRETLFGAVQRFFATEDGGMWGIAPSFRMETLIAPTALLGQYADGWTLTELLDTAENLPEGTYLMGGLTQENAERSLLGQDGYAAFIDTENAVCSFDSPEFLRWLNFCASLPADLNTLRASGGLDNPRSENLQAYYENHVLLQNIPITNGFQDLPYLESTFGTKDWTLVGFPAEGHNGTAVFCDAATVMTSFCTDPDLAWELIRALISETWAAISNNPALEPKEREYEAQFMGYGYTIISYNGLSRSVRGGDALNGEIPKQEDLTSPGWVCFPTWEDYDRYVDLLNSVIAYPMTESVPPEITSIISEEISAFFGGVGTAEDCAKKIQSRVSIWLSEHQ